MSEGSHEFIWFEFRANLEEVIEDDGLVSSVLGITLELVTNSKEDFFNKFPCVVRKQMAVTSYLSVEVDHNTK